VSFALDQHDIAPGLRRLDGSGDTGDATAHDEQRAARSAGCCGAGVGHRSESRVRYFTGRLIMVHSPVSGSRLVLQKASQLAWSIVGLSERT